MSQTHTIATVKALEVFDSRGQPTIEVSLTLADGSEGSAIVPSGASTGSLEALELRDKDAQRFLGKGVLTAVANVNTTIANAIVKREWQQNSLDNALCDLDGSDNKSHLGANAILAVSMAFARAAAGSQKQALYQYIATLCNNSQFILPTPLMNIINGGAHADNNIDIQEFMIVPQGNNFREAFEKGVSVFHSLKALLKKRGLSTSVGDEGGFAPSLHSNHQALEYLMEAISNAGFTPGKEISIAMDCASTEFFVDGHYRLASEKQAFSTQEWMQCLATWVNDYPIVSIEDPLREGDFAAWKELTAMLGNKVRIVGDDLFVTNPAIIRQGIQSKAANSVLIKLNQIGTVTETLEAIALTQEAGWDAIISHRSGESEDTFIADLAVGTAAGFIKTGAPSRSDRVAKYNRLLRIESEIA